MRLAVLADIHANLPALEAVLADAAQHDVAGIVVAGDHVTTGPYPAETFRWLRSLGCWLIRGNTDDYLLTYDAGDAPASWRAGDQWASLRWVYDRLDRETLDWLAALPAQQVIALDSAAPIRVVHGSPNSPSRHLFPDRDPAALHSFRQAGILSPGQDPPALSRTLAQIDEPVLVCGHSHIPWQQAQNGRLALNPGSVGFPIDGDVRAHASRALLTWDGEHWQVQHRAVPYDMDRTRAAYRESGLLAEGGSFTRAWVLGMETGQNVAGRLVVHACRLAVEAGHDDIPDAVWEQAVATFDWAARP